MASTRAQDVAEVLWELKRADKVATFTLIAERAGFSAGANGRAVQTALKTVRRDWAHLEWWRAIKDDGLVEKDSEHAERLRESGYDLESVDGKKNAVKIAAFDEHLMMWEADDEQADE